MVEISERLQIEAAKKFYRIGSKCDFGFSSTSFVANFAATPKNLEVSSFQCSTFERQFSPWSRDFLSKVPLVTNLEIENSWRYSAN